MSSRRSKTSKSGKSSATEHQKQEDQTCRTTKVLSERNQTSRTSRVRSEKNQTSRTSRVLSERNQTSRTSRVLSERNQASRTSRVLSERNQAVVAVGVWVEEGQDSPEDPSALALLTDEIQAEKRRLNEESLRRFQDEVRHRVALKTPVCRKREQPQASSGVKQQDLVWTQHLSSAAAAEQRVKERSSQQSVEGMRQVRLRLAACRVTERGEMASERNISPGRHRYYVHREEQVSGEEEDKEEEGDDHPFIGQHKCPLVHQKVSAQVLSDPEEAQPDSAAQVNLRVLWPLSDLELKRQRQSQFLVHRRLYMNIEREQAKENKQHRKHLKRTARIKSEKEQLRLEEERRLETDRQLAEARQRLEERELLILERLRLEEEEEEERAVELQRRRREEKGKTQPSFIEALRAQLKVRLSQEQLDLPPLCCCASSFWESHPDTCANNCVFYNNPKEYAKALHSTMRSLAL